VTRKEDSFVDTVRRGAGYLMPAPPACDQCGDTGQITVVITMVAVDAGQAIAMDALRFLKVACPDCGGTR